MVHNTNYFRVHFVDLLIFFGIFHRGTFNNYEDQILTPPPLVVHVVIQWPPSAKCSFLAYQYQTQTIYLKANKNKTQGNENIFLAIGFETVYAIILLLNLWNISYDTKRG